MKTTRTSVLGAVALVLMSCWGLAGLASAQDGSTIEDPGTYGRVREADNGLTIERANDDEPGGRAERNSPVFPGDVVRTDPGQRVEIELAGGTLVRLDGDTELTFVSLPDPYADVADHTVLQLSRGTARVISRLAENQELRFDTPTTSVYAVDGGDVRVDVAPDGTTDVASVRGVVEVAGSGGSVVVRSGMRTAVRPDEYPDEAIAFNSFGRDGFDRWCADRDQAYASHDDYDADYDDEAYREVPQEVRPYYRELSSHGRWVDTPDYGYVWYPTGVYSGWRPYNDGYWSYGPSGYFWVGSEPWGWAPYHYGRWAWSSPYGWCWVPGRVFAGAWVAWSWGSVHIGWAPLGYWNQPVYIRTPYYGYYDPGCWTFVNYSHFYGHGSCARYAVPYNTVNVQSHVVVARAPYASPTRLVRSPEVRLQAARDARAISASRVQAIERGVRPTENVRDVERRLVADRGRLAVSRGSTLNQRGQVAAGSRAAARFPRQLTQAGGRAAVPNGRTARPLASVDRNGTADADRRVRDLYQRMASPRTTRDAPGATRQQASPAPRPRPETGTERRTATPQRPRPSTAPRSSAGPATPQRPRPSTAPRASAGPTASPRPSPRSSFGAPRAGANGDVPERSAPQRPAPQRRTIAPRTDVERDMRDRVAPQPGPSRRVTTAPRTNVERDMRDRVAPQPGPSRRVTTAPRPSGPRPSGATGGGRVGPTARPSAPRAAPPQPRSGTQSARPPAPQRRDAGPAASPRATGRGSGGGKSARESGDRGKEGRR